MSLPSTGHLPLKRPGKPAATPMGWEEEPQRFRPPRTRCGSRGTPAPEANWAARGGKPAVYHPSQTGIPVSIRQKALFKILIGFGIFSLILAWVYHADPGGKSHFNEPTLMALPGAIGLLGLLEFITGRRFSQFAGSWDRLKGWQRGLLGTAIALLTSTTILAVLYFISTNPLQRLSPSAATVLVARFLLAVLLLLLGCAAAVAGGAIVFLLLAKVAGYQLGFLSRSAICPNCHSDIRIPRFLAYRNSNCSHCGFPVRPLLSSFSGAASSDPKNLPFK